MYSSNRTYSRAILGLSAVLTLSFTSLVAPVNAEEPETVVPAIAELEGEAPATLRSAETGLFDAAPPKPVARGAAGDLQLPAVNEKEVFEEGRVVRPPDENGQRCYRIPALITAKDGSLLLAFDDRYGPDEKSKTWCRDAPYDPGNSSAAIKQTDIALYRSVNDGKTFENYGFIAQGTKDSRGLSYTDPALVVDRSSGKIFAFFVRGYDKRVAQAVSGYHSGNVEGPITNRNVQDTVVIESEDNGRTWKNMKLISNLTDKVVVGGNTYTGRGRFVTSGSGVQLKFGLHAGRLIVPIAVDIDQSDSAKFVNLAIYSDDGGDTWEIGEGVAGVGYVSGDENKIIELSDGRLMMNSKEFKGGMRWSSYSEDQGKTWSDPVDHLIAPPDHPNMYNAGINVGLIRAYPNAPENSAAAKVLLYSAPIDSRRGSDFDTDGRKNGWVMGSCDDGKTWSFGRQVEKSRFQYSSMAVMSDGNIGMVYESGTREEGMNLKFAKFNMAWLGADCLSNEALGLTGDIDKEIVAAQEKAAAATKEAQEAAEKVEKLTEELAAARKENDELKTQVKESEEAVEDLADEVFKLKNAVTEAKEKATVAEKAAFDALAKLQKVESIAEEQKAKAESAAAEAQALREKLERLEGSILTVKENPEAEESADLSSAAKDAADAARRAATDANGALSGQKQDEEKPAMGLMGILKVLAGIIPLVAIIATIFQTFRLPFNIPGMR
ncbi:sialidase-1 [Corynebacterium diphtheriae BH8]|uniref:exo-alpha-sialidase NanH n=1 Tax=Corynebacterium diphtheriae TaxID=1717 RepID=UPI000245B24A|nr:exo-alpha-sialidase [Corynebacterium diphtheriae]AEX48020.1 sialidase-1 [Corynebacterium diphtheriae BH8]MBG9356167.1 exo-alpha-sialidase [Corynebacterium diphtheriae bv. mitis]TBX18772.1 sialidase [Corynebacterium diphtheriae]